MSKIITIYHGSPTVVQKPDLKHSKKNNDFGVAFYCTRDNELAKEWSVAGKNSGFSNRYSLDIEGLKILNLNTPEYSVLNWIAILVKHRFFSLTTPLKKEAYDYFINNYYIDVDDYDIIIGYRADDSYFRLADDFLSNTISVAQLSKALMLGNLGEQVVIKSEKAIARLKFEGYEIADSEIYLEKREKRNKVAEDEYFKIASSHDRNLYTSDILREDIKNDDPRIPRNTSK